MSKNNNALTHPTVHLGASMVSNVQNTVHAIQEATDDSQVAEHLLKFLAYNTVYIQFIATLYDKASNEGLNGDDFPDFAGAAITPYIKDCKDEFLEQINYIAGLINGKYESYLARYYGFSNLGAEGYSLITLIASVYAAKDLSKLSSKNQDIWNTMHRNFTSEMQQEMDAEVDAKAEEKCRILIEEKLKERALQAMEKVQKCLDKEKAKCVQWSKSLDVKRIQDRIDESVRDIQEDSISPDKLRRLIERENLKLQALKVMDDIQKCFDVDAASCESWSKSHEAKQLQNQINKYIDAIWKDNINPDELHRLIKGKNHIKSVLQENWVNVKTTIQEKINSKWLDVKFIFLSVIRRDFEAAHKVMIQKTRNYLNRAMQDANNRLLENDQRLSDDFIKLSHEMLKKMDNFVQNSDSTHSKILNDIITIIKEGKCDPKSFMELYARMPSIIDKQTEKQMKQVYHILGSAINAIDAIQGSEDFIPQVKNHLYKLTYWLCTQKEANPDIFKAYAEKIIRMENMNFEEKIQGLALLYNEPMGSSVNVNPRVSDFFQQAERPIVSESIPTPTPAPIAVR